MKHIHGYTITAVHRIEALSDETLCFTAVIRRWGVKVGNVENRGHGGPHEYGWMAREHRDTFEREADAWAKENGDDYAPDDALIDALLTREADAKVAKRFAKRGYPFTVKVGRGKIEGPNGEHYGYRESVFIACRTKPTAFDLGSIERANKGEAAELVEVE